MNGKKENPRSKLGMGGGGVRDAPEAFGLGVEIPAAAQRRWRAGTMMSSF